MKNRMYPLLVAGMFSALMALSSCSVLTADSGLPHNPSRASGGKVEEVAKEENKRPATNTRRSEVVSYARKYLGAEYRSGGKGPKSFDCSGFTSYVMKEFDVSLSAASRYQEKDGRKVRLKDVQPGDLIFFRRSPAGSVFHVALVVNNSREGIEVIHSTSRGVVIDNISKSDYWAPKISSARDVLGDIR